MCAINGFNFSDSNLIKIMNQSVAHRGPDGTGLFCDDFVSIGHNLLAISDRVENSFQPVVSGDSNFVLSYNGEIYNYRELRLDLEKNGESFKTDSDTEVLFIGLRKEGISFLNKLDGMFAIALYDGNKKTITIARDRAGMKPLYYYLKDNKFIFSSEIRGIISHDIERYINKDYLPIYLALGYLPGQMTLFKDINRVRPGEIITYNIEDNNIKSSFINTVKYSWDGNIKELISKSVKNHTMGLRPFGLYLSGGLDSTVILHELVNNGVDNVNTFSTRFDIENDKFNEDAIGANKLSDSYSINHTELLITEKDFTDNYIEAIKTIEEPRNNSSISAYLLLAKKASVGTTVILTGDGGDELFGGYQKYLISRSLTNKFKKWPKFLVNLRSNIAGYMKGRIGFGDYFDLLDPYTRWLYLNMSNSPSSINRYSKVKFNKKNFVKYIKNNTNSLGDDFENSIMELDSRNWLADEDFIRNDKILMKYSMEGRFPFLSNKLVNASKLIPSSLKMEDGISKRVIRKIYRGLIPDYIIDKRKTGWNAPASAWMKSYFGNFVKSVLSNDYYNTGLIDIEAFRKDFVDNKESFTMTDMARIMTFVSFQVWAKEFNMK